MDVLSAPLPFRDRLIVVKTGGVLPIGTPVTGSRGVAASAVGDVRFWDWVPRTIVTGGRDPEMAGLLRSAEPDDRLPAIGNEGAIPGERFVPPGERSMPDGERPVAIAGRFPMLGDCGVGVTTDGDGRDGLAPGLAIVLIGELFRCVGDAPPPKVRVWVGCDPRDGAAFIRWGATVRGVEIRGEALAVGRDERKAEAEGAAARGLGADERAMAGEFREGLDPPNRGLWDIREL